MTRLSDLDLALLHLAQERARRCDSELQCAQLRLLLAQNDLLARYEVGAGETINGETGEITRPSAPPKLESIKESK